MSGSLPLALRIALTVSGPSVAPLTAAQDAANRAMELRARGDLAGASEALGDAYRLYPDRDYLFMRAAIERDRGDCDAAIPLFEAFIDEYPTLPDVEDAQRELQACGVAEPYAAAPGPAPAPLPAEPEPAQPVIPLTGQTDGDPGSQPTKRAWPRDAIGGALLGSGLVVATTGAVLLVAADGRARRASDAPNAGDYRDQRGGAQTLSITGWAVLGVGASVLIGGVIRYVVVARRGKSRARVVGIAPGAWLRLLSRRAWRGSG